MREGISLTKLFFLRKGKRLLEPDCLLCKEKELLECWIYVCGEIREHWGMTTVHRERTNYWGAVVLCLTWQENTLLVGRCYLPEKKGLMGRSSLLLRKNGIIRAWLSPTGKTVITRVTLCSVGGTLSREEYWGGMHVGGGSWEAYVCGEGLLEHCCHLWCRRDYQGITDTEKKRLMYELLMAVILSTGQMHY